jgi:hypothetical protein
MRSAQAEAPLALTVLARPPKVFRAYAFRIPVVLALAFAPALHASAGASEARGADRPEAPPEPSVVLNDAIKLCERLAGVEREICLRQAEEDRERAADAGVGATPGSGSMTVGGATAPGAR